MTKRLNWGVHIIDGKSYVVPIDDVRAHDIAGLCWCEPSNKDGVIVHNALDQREVFERVAT